jgi:lipopolysaccharide/colanic/teichoic acid biosynthesis glycosyltransferase
VVDDSDFGRADPMSAPKSIEFVKKSDKVQKTGFFGSFRDTRATPATAWIGPLLTASENRCTLRWMQRVPADARLSWLPLALLDATILLAAGASAAWLRFGSYFFPAELANILDHPGFILYAVLIQLGLATTFDLYRPQGWRAKDYVLIRMAALAVSLAVALAVGVYLVMPWRFGRGLLLLTLLQSLPLQTAVRFLWLAVAERPRPRRAAVIGDGPIIDALENELEGRRTAPFQVVAHIRSPDGSPPDEVTPECLDGIDLVVVASLVHDATADRLAALNFRGTTVLDAAGAYAALTGRIPVRQVDSRWFIATGDFSTIATSPFHHVQRFLDVVTAAGLLILTSPILLLAAAATLVSSGTPVLYRQTRLGRYGEPFVLTKLRTMREAADGNGPEFAEANDRRVLPVGRLLRRWRIDELPQLFNVIRGNMSLVGPRPERPEVAERLERDIPFYAFRYSVRPGLTGWAQVNMPYAADTEDHIAKLEYDLYLLRHYGPAMYGIVLLRTVGALVFRPGR